jgi:hypothetical protein
MKLTRGKPKYSGETCPSATLSTTNPTWTDQGSNLGLRGERTATNCLSYGTAHSCTVRLLLTDMNNVFKYRDLRKIFGHKRENGGNCIMRSSLIFVAH